MKWLRWLLWRLVYVLRPAPTEFGPYLLYGERTRPPWWTFRPGVYRNKDGKMWQVTLIDERSYTAPGRTVRVELYVGMESGRVVGLDLWDESLEKAAEAAGGEHGT